jgi:hypothetical protein
MGRLQFGPVMFHVEMQAAMMLLADRQEILI